MIVHVHSGSWLLQHDQVDGLSGPGDMVQRYIDSLRCTGHRQKECIEG